MFSRILEQILDFVYPPKCILCDEITPLKHEKYLCSNCKEFFIYIEGETCISCGIKVEHKDAKCRSCRDKNNLFTRNIPIFVYEDVIQDVIYKFKYGKRSHLGRGMGILMSNKLLKTPHIFESVDYIAPIPIHKNRMRTRGFNQAELLAKEISIASNVPMAKNLIVRKRDTKPQSRVSFLGRKTNLEGAFVANRRYSLKDKKIFLVDDIYTTGSTLNACCEVLYVAGAKEVAATTFSIVLKK